MASCCRLKVFKVRCLRISQVEGGLDGIDVLRMLCEMQIGSLLLEEMSSSGLLERAQRPMKK
jgi:hypothetical protein